MGHTGKWADGPNAWERFGIANFISLSKVNLGIKVV